ncbi:MAG: RNA-binding protein [Candidatus Eisenbacteria bacterium]
MKLYVGNLSFNTTEDELRNLFSQHGAVQEVNVITDRYTGQSRGFGFVQMDNNDGAKAISAVDGVALGGRNLKVSEAQPKREGGGDGGGRRERW